MSVKKGTTWGDKRTMAENERADRSEGLGRRWVIISFEHRAKLHRWIKRNTPEHQRASFTINGAMSKFLADAIDQIQE